MTVRFVHTADLQLGMPFHRVPGEAGAQLRLRRLESIERIVDLAHDRRADFVLVAGDLFDANTVSSEIVQKSLERFARSTVPIYVLPGNHDHCGAPDSVFGRAEFQSHRPRHMHVLTSREPCVLLDGRAVILPAPLIQRHESGDTTAHITADLGRELAPNAVRIGLAHGSVITFERESDADLDDGDGAQNFIAPDRAARAALDYLALGDWHGRKEVAPKTWYSGAPEPTSFKQNHAGEVLWVEIDGPGAPPRVEAVTVARTRWLRHSVALNATADLEALEAWYASLEARHDTLVRLELSGALPLAEMDRLETLIDTMRNGLVHLAERGPGVTPALGADEADALAGEGFMRSAVATLRARASLAGDDGRIAALALHMLHGLRRKVAPP